MFILFSADIIGRYNSTLIATCLTVFGAFFTVYFDNFTLLTLGLAFVFSGTGCYGTTCNIILAENSGNFRNLIF